MTKQQEYKKDYAWAMAHPVEGRGITCPRHLPRDVYYHPVLGCPECGKYADIECPARRKKAI